MGYMTDGLTFNALRQANTHRLPTFKNARGEPAHSEPDGSDWLLSAWSNAVTGELGEAANIIKKIERGDLTLDEARPALAKEFADVVTYLDILAFRAGVDLGRATIAKFNEISDRVGSPVHLREDGSDYFLAQPGESETVRVSFPGGQVGEINRSQIRSSGEHAEVLKAAGVPAEGDGGEHGDVLRAAGIPGY